MASRVALRGWRGRFACAEHRAAPRLPRLVAELLSFRRGLEAQGRREQSWIATGPPTWGGGMELGCSRIPPALPFQGLLPPQCPQHHCGSFHGVLGSGKPWVRRGPWGFSAPQLIPPDGVSWGRAAWCWWLCPASPVVRGAAVAIATPEMCPRRGDTTAGHWSSQEERGGWGKEHATGHQCPCCGSGQGRAGCHGRVLGRTGGGALPHCSGQSQVLCRVPWCNQDKGLRWCGCCWGCAVWERVGATLLGLSMLGKRNTPSSPAWQCWRGMGMGLVRVTGTSAAIVALQPSALGGDVPVLPAPSAFPGATPHLPDPIPITAGCAGPSSTLLLTSAPSPVGCPPRCSHRSRSSKTIPCPHPLMSTLCSSYPSPLSPKSVSRLSSPTQLSLPGQLPAALLPAQALGLPRTPHRG